MRIMAIDYGDAHTGVAISDPTGLLAGTTTTIHSRKGGVVLEELKKLVDAYRVEELVMGFPRNMDGTEGPRAQLYRDFADQVEEVTGLKPIPVGRAEDHRGRPPYPFCGRTERQKAEKDSGRRGGLPDSGGLSEFQTNDSAIGVQQI